MRRSVAVAVALVVLLPWTGGGARAGAVFLGPGWGLTGNDTGGIMSYTPALQRSAYRAMAADWCARWGRLSHITSVHRHYGDYVGFVCMDRPGMIH
jgi:hypothetical protein